MTNNVSVLNKQKYTKTVQALLQEKLIAMDLAKVDLRSNFGDGNTINYPRPVYNNITQYTKYTNVTDQDVVYSNETMTIDQIPMISFVYDEIDEIENGYDVLAEQAKDNAFRMRQYIEGKFFNAVTSAYTNAAAVTISTVSTDATFSVKVYGQAMATLVNAGVDDSALATVVDPYTFQKIGQGALSNTFNVADEVYKRGYKGSFNNTMLYVSANLKGSCVLNFATNPTAGNSITINGVVFTFRATAAAAGDVYIGASAAATLLLLVAAVNNANGYASAAGVSTTYFEVSKADRARLQSLTAAQVSTTMTLTSLRGYRVVSSNMTAAADDWGDYTVETLVMQKGSVDLVLQKAPNVKIQDVPGQLASRYMTWSKFGVKTFTDGAEKIVIVPVIVQAAEA